MIANDGREALALLDSQPFDLVLMDVQMPEMDGFEATAAIRQREQATGAHIPIIAMTAYAMKGDRERCLEAGMDSYVSKPIQAEELFRAIEGLLPAPAEAEVKASALADQPSEEVFDRAAVLAHVDGDEELLREVVRLFLDSCPGQLSNVKQAVARRDRVALERAVHTLKGSVSNMAARPAFEAALRLETMDREEDLTRAEEVCTALEGEIERLKMALAAVVKGAP